ncbi:MAG: UDP-glucose/GDP-mannose dehydrogenase family protein [Rikenellaceae bacterium]
MKIVIVGTGYVGLVTGSCFAQMGTDVTCIDIDEKKIESLKNGIIPIFEPGLDELVSRNVAEGRLKFSTSLKDNLDGAQLIFSAVGTPPDEDGSADLQYVMEVARTVGRYANDYFVLVTKSTVPVGTVAKVRDVLESEIKNRGIELEFDVASNPEFLKEGAAIKDFMTPDRIIIGVESDRARKLLDKLYKPFILNRYRIYFMDIHSAEMTKYAANAMLATRISFMNEIANLCELVGADVEQVRKGIGADARIGSKFLYAGAGYGGSCFPKDVKALSRIGKENGFSMQIIDAVDSVNEQQKFVVFKKLLNAFGGNLKGRRVALWGLSYKPETDDMREAPSLVVIRELLGAGAIVQAYDPVAIDATRKIIGDSIIFSSSVVDAVKGVDAVILMTEWRQFRIIDWVKIKSLMVGDVVVDGRNIYDEAEVKEQGFRYYRIGKTVY